MNEDSRHNFKQSNYVFNLMVNQGLIFVGVTTMSFAMRIAFAFIDDIRLQWRIKYGDAGKNASPFEMKEFAKVLMEKMEFYGNDSMDKMKTINKQMEVVKEQLVSSLDKVLERGKNMEKLKEKTESLQINSLTIKRKAEQANKKMKSKSCWLTFFIIVLVLVIIYGVAAGFCHGPLLPDCLKFIDGNNTIGFSEFKDFLI